MAREIKTVVKDLHYLECPRWHEERIWFVDFYSYKVYSAQEDGSDLRVEAEVPGQPSGLGWLPDGRLLIVSMRDHRILRRETDGELVTHADLGDHVTQHLNDMVVDEQGRAYVGNFGFDIMAGADLASTHLLRVDPDGTVAVVAEDLWFPNGSVITPDGALLVDETCGNRISAFDIAADGSLTNRRTWAKFGELTTHTAFGDAMSDAVLAPDGCCLDAEGAMWVADAVFGRLVRVAEGGEILEQIEPGGGVFACMLGGSDGKTLYACAAPDFFEEPRKATTEARLLAIRVDVPGAGLP
ncbi:sugar lactone lactonase YvrE [Nocardioides albertanoniae]|uniref:Sugar lactone lactonase YvrE n=1 Tax=Nocardioides albertanoniae TaxID=1175486 RepID=A0A543A6K8_9ACTN|nr:SMP-30/gluconolactonase/LRE family protein [Nocardioides albertanoniae]TQL68241.1 sugar lactone lactonase YvrE [Nocardioides albertanoniae]